MANKPGASLSFGDLFGLAKAIGVAVGEGFAGSAVVQGTDTIEETAYLLDLPAASDATVVVIGGHAQPVAGRTRRPGERPDALPGAGAEQSRANWP